MTTGWEHVVAVKVLHLINSPELCIERSLRLARPQYANYWAIGTDQYILSFTHRNIFLWIGKVLIRSTDLITSKLN